MALHYPVATSQFTAEAGETCLKKNTTPAAAAKMCNNARSYVVTAGEEKMMRGGDFFSVHPNGKPAQRRGAAFRRLVAVNYF